MNGSTLIRRQLWPFKEKNIYHKKSRNFQISAAVIHKTAKKVIAAERAAEDWSETCKDAIQKPEGIVPYTVLDSAATMRKTCVTAGTLVTDNKVISCFALKSLS